MRLNISTELPQRPATQLTADDVDSRGWLSIQQIMHPYVPCQLPSIAACLRFFLRLRGRRGFALVPCIFFSGWDIPTRKVCHTQHFYPVSPMPLLSTFFELHLPLIRSLLLPYINHLSSTSPLHSSLLIPIATCRLPFVFPPCARPLSGRVSPLPLPLP